MHFAQDADTSGFFEQLARLGDRARYQMLFATLNPIAQAVRNQMESYGVPCLSLDSSRPTYPWALLRLARHLRRSGASVAHTHLFEPSVVGMLAAALARIPVRIVTRHHSDYHTRIHRDWHVRLDRMCTRLATVVIAVSEHTRDHMIAAERAPAGKIVTILNGIDFDRVRPSSPAAAGRVRGEFSAGEARLLLVPARLHPEKGHSHLFRALPELRRRAAPFLVLLAGEGSFESQYRQEVWALGCEDVVRFLGFRRDLPDLMTAADVVVLPSVAEAFGLVLAEALYLGIPVVATRAGGIPEIVDDGIDGVLVPAADSGALADVLATLLTSPDRRAALAGRGRDRISARFSFQQMVRSYEALYSGLLSAPPTCRATRDERVRMIRPR